MERPWRMGDRYATGQVAALSITRFVSVQPRHHGDALDLAAHVGAQERFIIAERHASIRLAVRAEHEGVGKKAGAAEHLILLDWNEPQRLYAVEQAFTRLQIVDGGRCGAAHSFVGVTRVVEPGAETRMRLQSR